MENNDVNYEENIAKLLGKMTSFFKQVGLEELSEKNERILTKYRGSKKLD
jgi:hypothetical protein